MIVIVVMLIDVSVIDVVITGCVHVDVCSCCGCVSGVVVVSVPVVLSVICDVVKDVVH